MDKCKGRRIQNERNFRLGKNEFISTFSNKARSRTLLTYLLKIPVLLREALNLYERHRAEMIYLVLEITDSSFIAV